MKNQKKILVDLLIILILVSNVNYSITKNICSETKKEICNCNKPNTTVNTHTQQNQTASCCSLHNVVLDQYNTQNKNYFIPAQLTKELLESPQIRQNPCCTKVLINISNNSDYEAVKFLKSSIPVCLINHKILDCDNSVSFCIEA